MMAGSADEISRTLAAGRGRRRLPWWGWVLGLVALALAGWALWSAQTGESKVRYVTEAVARGPMTVVVTATGTVQPTTQVDISSELSGTISAVEVDYNDTVAVGQVLARLDDTKLRAQLANARASLTAATARVAQAEASLREAEANFETAQALDQRGVSSHQSFIAARAVHDRARAALDVARADATLAAANMEMQEADLAKATIRSPILGVVLDREADAGQIVASSLSAPVLFVLAEDLAQMELLVDIDEADIGRVQVGNTASFTVEAHSGRVFPAVLTAVRYAPETTDGVVTYKAELSVDNADLALRPGMTATASIIVAQAEDALQVPNAALRFAPPQVVQRNGGGSGLLGLIMPARPGASAGQAAAARSLWVLRDGVAAEITVETGDSDGRNTIILAGDLAAGDLVITDQSGAE